MKATEEPPERQMFSAKINHVVTFQLGWSQSFVIKQTKQKKESLQTAAFGVDARIISEELKTSERRSKPGGGLGGLRTGRTEETEGTEDWGVV